MDSYKFFIYYVFSSCMLSVTLKTIRKKSYLTYYKTATTTIY